MAEAIVNRIKSEIYHIEDTWCEIVPDDYFPNDFNVNFGIQKFSDSKSEFVDLNFSVDDSTDEGVLRHEIDAVLLTSN